MALVVAATGLALAFGQRLDGLPFPQRRLVDEDQAAPRRAGRIMCLECHVSLASDTGGEVDGLAIGQRHDSLIHVGPRVGKTLPTIGLALLGKRVDARQLDAEKAFNSSLALRPV